MLFASVSLLLWPPFPPGLFSNFGTLVPSTVASSRQLLYLLLFVDGASLDDTFFALSFSIEIIVPGFRRLAWC
jgi:hypothetical protein